MVTPDIVATAEAEEAWRESVSEGGNTVEKLPDRFLKVGEIISTPSESSMVESHVSSLRYKGYLPYWDTKTGVYNECPHWFRWQVALMTHEDGTKMYTFTNPHIAPNYGQDLCCPLNPASPEYHRIDGLGFKLCKRVHIPHQDALEAHVQKSHKRAAAALRRDREERIRDEDRELQRETLRSNQELLRAMLGRSDPGVAIAPSPTNVADISPHAHRYDKSEGSVCKTAGCTAVRTVPYRKWKQKK
jgi:hypothetical protein